MINENTEYELLAKEIYQTINADEGFKHIDVQHNVKLVGKSGCKHQIDVYWEFENMGETHKVAIECKNFSTEVSVGRVRDFFGVIHDIGDVKGVFVTKVGYQSGAVKFAEHYNISLKEMRPPEDQDWNGRARDLVVNINKIELQNVHPNPDLDIEWLEKNTSYKEGDRINIHALNNDLLLKDSQGNLIKTIRDLESELPHDWKNEKERKHKFKFDEDTFFELPNGDQFKILGIMYTYDVTSSDVSKLKIEGDSIAKAILKDVRNGQIKFYNKDGQIK